MAEFKKFLCLVIFFQRIKKQCCPRAEDRTFSRTCKVQGQGLQNMSYRTSSRPRTSSRIPPLCFSVAILPALSQKINFWKIALNYLEKQLIYNSDPLLCFDNNTAKNTDWNLQKYTNSLIFWLLLAILVKFLRGKSLLRGNLNSIILGTEGRRKLKFGEVSLHFCQNLSRESREKFVLT